jgi:hypothetical protein
MLASFLSLASCRSLARRQSATAGRRIKALALGGRSGWILSASARALILALPQRPSPPSLQRIQRPGNLRLPVGRARRLYPADYAACARPGGRPRNDDRHRLRIHSGNGLPAVRGESPENCGCSNAPKGGTAPRNPRGPLLSALPRNASGAGSGVVPPDPRRVRSTRRRDDLPDLPRVPVEDRIVGRVFTASDGREYRPSMFLTLTLPSYGPVRNGVLSNLNGPGTRTIGRSLKNVRFDLRCSSVALRWSTSKPEVMATLIVPALARPGGQCVALHAVPRPLL